MGVGGSEGNFRKSVDSFLHGVFWGIKLHVIRFVRQVSFSSYFKNAISRALILWF